MYDLIQPSIKKELTNRIQYNTFEKNGIEVNRTRKIGIKHINFVTDTIVDNLYIKAMQDANEYEVNYNTKNTNKLTDTDKKKYIDNLLKDYSEDKKINIELKKLQDKYELKNYNTGLPTVLGPPPKPPTKRCSFFSTGRKGGRKRTKKYRRKTRRYL